ncbi:MAG TPA: DUF1549 domain-containing protein, partial [Gemmataceae bacterium]|nr:DUF1549 domain-containing protein [Gemmataceae bacterium]
AIPPETVMNRAAFVPLAALAICLAPARASAAVDYQRDVRPILADTCFKCHGPDDNARKGKLRLDSRAGALKGGRNGPAIVPGKPDDSELVKRLTSDSPSEVMPPPSTGKKLSPAQIRALRQWIAEGANYSAPWAYVAPRRPALPAVKRTDWARNAIDLFILARLEREGLSPSPAASSQTLLRRLSLDLLGLPPAPAEIDAFLADRRPDAYERMVERYLASSHYGERWGKYWLDTVGYADSNGYFNADSDRPLAWRYRDYVLRAFNADKPYDRFLQEQLAGDELAGYRPGGDVTADTAELLTATHFLRNAPDGTGESDGNPDEVLTDRFTVLEGTLQITMNALQGITIQCARCHRHKFEPVSQQEYYQLQAIFFPAYNPARWTKPQDRVVPVGTRAELAEWKQRTERIDREVKAGQAKLAAPAGKVRDQLLGERLKHLAPGVRDQVLQAVKAPPGKRTGAQKALLKEHAKAVEISDGDLAKGSPEHAALSKQVRATVAALEKDRPRPLEKLAAFVETDPNPPAHHVLRRGRHNQPGEPVEPGVPAALSTAANVYRVPPRPNDQVSTGRRLALARWITAPENPLTARVMLNRIWQHHFGTGLGMSSVNAWCWS